MITGRTARTATTPHIPDSLGEQPVPGSEPVAAAPIGSRPPSVDEARATGVFGEMRGLSPAMLALYGQIQRVAPTGATVLLAGETGTGKEVVARTIHDLSHRRDAAFVAINCGAITAELVESELFGHEQGSFTGATRRHNGVFTQANLGTLFLDEITEMPIHLQVKLLRVLETGLFNRVGGEKQVQTDVRIIAAGNLPPEQAMREGKLREDLFYRLRVFPILLPPLRSRGADIQLLAEHFLALQNHQNHTDKQFTRSALDRLQAYSWPGNVRDLRHFVQQAYILADHAIDASSLDLHGDPSIDDERIEIRVGTSIAVAEQQLITATMRRFEGNKTTVARLLGISLKTLYCRLNLYAAADEPQR